MVSPQVFGQTSARPGYSAVGAAFEDGAGKRASRTENASRRRWPLRRFAIRHREVPPPLFARPVHPTPLNGVLELALRAGDPALRLFLQLLRRDAPWAGERAHFDVAGA